MALSENLQQLRQQDPNLASILDAYKEIEETFQEALEAMGHKLADTDGSFGGYQAIMRDAAQGVYYGASEVRKDGQAAGY